TGVEGRPSAQRLEARGEAGEVALAAAVAGPPGAAPVLRLRRLAGPLGPALRRAPPGRTRRLRRTGRGPRRRALRQRIDRDALARQLLDVAEIGPLLAVAERDRDALGAGPGGAADAVDIGLRDIGQVVVD